MPSLYVRLGEKQAIGVVIDHFLGPAQVDSQIGPMFVGALRNPNFRNHLVSFVCRSTGSEEPYEGRTMSVAHQGLRITNTKFDIVVRLLAESIDKFAVADSEKGELLGLLGGLREHVVGL